MVNTLLGQKFVSFLGTTMFLIFNNGIDSAGRTIENLHKFAEDTKLVQSATTSLNERRRQGDIIHTFKIVKDSTG